MDTFEAIEMRRSIRIFTNDPVPPAALEKILRAGTLAPSGKNKQPWKFYVIRGQKRDEMIVEMKKGIERLQKMGIRIGSARSTLEVMKQAPVTIFVFNPFSKHPLLKRDTFESFSDLVDIQSVGAAIQNMLLAAHALGLGTLWICDVFFAYEEFCAWLGETGEMIAAVSLGYSDQSPEARPRKSVNEVTHYVE
jgi:nitroreductase